MCSPAKGEALEPLGLTSREHRRLADVLRAAARDRRALEPLSTRWPELSLADAVRIRDALLARRISAGERLIGAKVSFDSAYTEPRLGWLTDGMLLSSPLIALHELIHPRTEPKLAFLLGRTVAWSTATASDLLAATALVLPCVEILDSRYDGRDGRLADQVADNCATARLLLGTGVAPPAEGHLRRLRAELDVYGAVPEPDRCAAAASSSLEAVSWLGSRLVLEGRAPQRGTLLVSPAVGGHVELAPNLRITPTSARWARSSSGPRARLAGPRAPQTPWTKRALRDCAGPPMSFSRRTRLWGDRARSCGLRRSKTREEKAMAGQVVHVEIPADDTAKGREFWGSLFGWRFEAYPGPFEYHTTEISEQTGAAITNMEPGKRGPRVYFDVDEINAAPRA